MARFRNEPDIVDVPYEEVEGKRADFHEEPSKVSADGSAIGSLICGIVGLFMFGIALGIIAIFLSNRSVKKNGITTAAKAGKVLGIIDIIAFFIALIYFMLIFMRVAG